VFLLRSGDGHQSGEARGRFGAGGLPSHAPAHGGGQYRASSGVQHDDRAITVSERGFGSLLRRRVEGDRDCAIVGVVEAVEAAVGATAAMRPGSAGTVPSAASTKATGGAASTVTVSPCVVRVRRASRTPPGDLMSTVSLFFFVA
jgi:hypothetical protein